MKRLVVLSVMALAIAVGGAFGIVAMKKLLVLAALGLAITAGIAVGTVPVSEVALADLGGGGGCSGSGC